MTGSSLLPASSTPSGETTVRFPTFKIVEPPRFLPIPAVALPSSCHSPFRWALAVSLEATYTTPEDEQCVFHLSVEPRCGVANNIPISWVMPHSTLVISSKRKPNPVSLIAYTTQDILHHSLSEFHMHMDINVLQNEVVLCRFTLTQPVCVSLCGLLQRASSLSRLVVAPIWSSIEPETIYSRQSRWRFQTAAFQPIGFVESHVLSPLRTFFQTKLHLPSEILLDKTGKWHWITAGPFEGLALSIKYSEEDESGSLTLQVFSSSQPLLDLFRRALGEFLADQIRFEALDDTALAANHDNQPTGPANSELSFLTDCLLAEIQFLTNQLETVIRTSMRERVPPVSSILESGIGGSLDLAYRLTEWRNLVTQSHMLPVSRLDPSPHYSDLCRRTDRTLEQLCCQRAPDARAI
ncbi:hypothetical protein CRM22_009777 [Opisthorchis felineus]|uniref:Uncharacterized protein n=1 Tax=Opisthorchis felineus TaxID=147828 RepID=A0A4V3SCS6_OPIFE|nr:hypothetical protein CRM22_009777 [Opisthorchis felineus]TGZ58004.1 hypothetical protein CRM22_009777 [Opisthorchis felineus]